MVKTKIAVLGILMMCPTLVFSYTRTEEYYTGDLSQSLSGFKTSIDQLSLTNEDISNQNANLKEQLKISQISLQNLTEESERLKGLAAQLEKNDLNVSKEISKYERQGKDLDAQSDQIKAQVKETELRLQQAQKEDLVLRKQLSGNALEVKDSSDEEMLEWVQRKQKEKVALLKMIAECQRRQSLLEAQILDLQKTAPHQDPTQNMYKKHQLEDQIDHIHQEITQLKLLSRQTQDSNHEEGWLQLEASVKDLENNQSELQTLVTKMQQKAKQIALSGDQQKEEAKLRGSLEPLQKEANNLKFDLHDLQQQMVELDKRKAHLEALSH